MKLRKAIIVIASLEVSLASSAYADPPRPDVNWKDSYSKENIIVEKGLVADSRFKAFRGTRELRNALV